uniref:3-hydroxyisobutyrate dehydrogenase, mitochondrial-like n=1 Tax=Ciona intestinalis TaxID=7719 RepID=UPI00006A42A9|nr:3-hydroxyisobutyrate dehydrogenase, mitochondrial-like [Ciona intestinalis]|eukprot:XP_002130423.1 3-hydroxyisobutyrate dehydrogenase, mitochondrial-like [Ciona intestinalis]
MAFLLRRVCSKAVPAAYSQISGNKCTGTVGFIGLGNMGGPMAMNLLKSGHKVVAFDVIEASTKPIVEAGGQIVSSPSEVAKHSTQIITMLPNSSHVQEVYLGSEGILQSVQAGSILIDSSTIDPAVSQNVAKQSELKSATYLDAPVSGGVGAAQAATLTFMVGGEKEDFETASHILNHVGKNVVHCGGVGTGQAAKICNNMLLAISMIGVSESMNLGIKLGLNPKILAGIINTSSGRCWSSDTYNPVPGVLPNVPSSNNYQGGFGTALMTKDLGLSQQAASATNSLTPMGASALQMYRMLCEKGFGEKDFSSVFKFLSENDK